MLNMPNIEQENLNRKKKHLWSELLGDFPRLLEYRDGMVSNTFIQCFSEKVSLELTGVAKVEQEKS